MKPVDLYPLTSGAVSLGGAMMLLLADKVYQRRRLLSGKLPRPETVEGIVRQQEDVRDALVAAMHEQVAALEGRIDDLKSQGADLKAQNANQEQRIKSLEHELRTKSAEADALERRCHEVTRERDDLRRENEEMRERLTSRPKRQ